MSELKKQKIRLSLSQQDEWEDYFNKHKSECLEIAAQLAAIDNELDNIVCDIYGLTSEDRQIVLEF